MPAVIFVSLCTCQGLNSFLLSTPPQELKHFRLNWTKSPVLAGIAWGWDHGWGHKGGLSSLVPAGTAQHTLGKTFLAGSGAWKLTATTPPPHWAAATGEPNSPPTTRKLTHSVWGCPRARRCKLQSIPLEHFAHLLFGLAGAGHGISLEKPWIYSTIQH